jgi:transglutaminase-like putative cysteine protease
MPSNALALPLGPRIVTATEGDQYTSFAYSSLTDTLVPDTVNASYFTTSWTLEPTALDSATVGRDLLNNNPQLFQVAKTPHLGQIEALTRQITEGASTDLQQIDALLNYFRGGGFRYDVNARFPDSSDPVWAFLQAKRGYCVHYATAMTLMLRILGIPARIATGVVVPQSTDGKAVQVTGDKAHAWPEVYFDNLGWVAFEPTPGIFASDSQSSSAAPSTSSGPSTTRPQSSAAPSSVDTAAPSATNSGTGPQPAAATGRRYWLWAGLAVLLVALGLVGGRFLARPRSPEETWQRLRSRALRSGLAAPGDTPTQIGAVISGRLHSRTAKSALAELLARLEAERYGADHAQPWTAARQRHTATAWLKAINANPWWRGKH